MRFDYREECHCERNAVECGKLPYELDEFISIDLTCLSLPPWQVAVAVVCPTSFTRRLDWQVDFHP